jgi:hypothetical protein
MKPRRNPEAFWQFFTRDGKPIASFPPRFHVNPYNFSLLMNAHLYAWKLPYARN